MRAISFAICELGNWTDATIRAISFCTSRADEPWDGTLPVRCSFICEQEEPVTGRTVPTRPRSPSSLTPSESVIAQMFCLPRLEEAGLTCFFLGFAVPVLTKFSLHLPTLRESTEPADDAAAFVLDRAAAVGACADEVIQRVDPFADRRRGGRVAALLVLNKVL